MKLSTCDLEDDSQGNKLKRNYDIPPNAPVENQRYDYLQNKSNSTAGTTQMEESLQRQLNDLSVCGIFLLFDLLILANVISLTAMVHQGRYLRGAPREG